MIWSLVPEGINGVILPIYADAFVDTRGVVRDACGFSGSAGVLVLTSARGWLCTDSRYSVQASREVDAQRFTVVDTYPKDAFVSGDVVALDYRCVTQCAQERWQDRVQACGARLEHADLARPVCAPSDVRAHTVTDASCSETIERLRATLNPCEGIVCSDEELLSWLMNVRSPARRFVPACALRALFISQHKAVVCVSQSLLSSLQKCIPDNIDVVDSQEFCRIAAEDGVEAWLCDKNLMTAFDAAKMPKDRVVWHENPCVQWKACKGEKSLQGARDAHRLEGAGLVTFLSDVHQGMTEEECVHALEKVRARSPHYWGPSFPTISAFGEHSAIVHYSPSAQSAAIQEGPWLLDAGGQYDSGTTDMTRTVFFGAVPQDFKEVYTRVLQAHIALASTRFPVGATGSQLDALARSVLWRYGWDYGHSTGHGVGASLNVHEAPPSLSARSVGCVRAGMVVSIEPGYYQEGLWGVRLENLYYVREDQGWCRFCPLTAVPFDVSLINHTCLSVQEREWLNAYHVFVRDELEGLLDDKARKKLLSDTPML